MTPYGLGLLAYAGGQTEAELVIRRDDGLAVPLAVGHYFRTPSEFTPIEQLAVDHCRGRVLDIGAGTGLHSLVLQARGLAVTAIDVSAEAVAIMAQRGVQDTRQADAFTFIDGPFDTLLMLGHGIGIVEDLAGLDRFLTHAHDLVAAHGQLLVDSQDVSQSDDPQNLAYHEANRRSGRYIGEVRIQIAFGEKQGPLCGWLHVDSEVLGRHAERAGWTCAALLEHETGEYLARLAPVRAV